MGLYAARMLGYNHDSHSTCIQDLRSKAESKEQAPPRYRIAEHSHHCMVYRKIINSHSPNAEALIWYDVQTKRNQAWFPLLSRSQTQKIQSQPIHGRSGTQARETILRRALRVALWVETCFIKSCQLIEAQCQPRKDNGHARHEYWAKELSVSLGQSCHDTAMSLLTY